jgi:hypothetical protein
MHFEKLHFMGIALSLMGCGSSPGATGPNPKGHDAGRPEASHVARDASAEEAAPRAEYSIAARIALEKDPDGEHVSFPTQNGSTVSVAVSDIVGKKVYWATTLGGQAIANVKAPLDEAITTVAPDLTADFTTPAHYKGGPYEIYCVISLTGSQMVPSPGDLAAFDNTPPPKGDPPDTGESVRVDLKGANATVTLDNGYFIRFGT